MIKKFIRKKCIQIVKINIQKFDLQFTLVGKIDLIKFRSPTN